jgi:hypothetical protein
MALFKCESGQRRLRASTQFNCFKGMRQARNRELCAAGFSLGRGIFNVEVRRLETISPAPRDQRPKFELPELVASLSKDSAPCPPPEFGAGPPIFPWLYGYGAAANPNTHRIHGTQPTLPN